MSPATSLIDPGNEDYVYFGHPPVRGQQPIDYITIDDSDDDNDDNDNGQQKTDVPSASTTATQEAGGPQTQQGTLQETQQPTQPPTQQATQPTKQEPTPPQSRPQTRSTTEVPGVSKEQQEQEKQPKTQVKRKRGRLRKRSKIHEEKARKMVEEGFGPEGEIEEHTLLVEEDTHGGTYPQVPIQPLQQSGTGNAPVIPEQPSEPPRLPVKKR